MKLSKIIIAGLLIGGLVAGATTFAASEGRKARLQEALDSLPVEVQSIAQKKIDGEELTDDEKSALREAVKAYKEENGIEGRGHGKRSHFQNLDLTDEQKEELAAIREAKKAGEELTSDQQAFVDGLKSQAREARLAELPDDIRSLVEKAHDEGRDSLTDEEKETLKTYREENGIKGHGHKKGKRGEFRKAALEDAPADIQAIVEKGRGNITDAERETLKEYFQSVRESRNED